MADGPAKGAAPAPTAINVVIPFVRGMLRPETRRMGERVGATFVDLTGDDLGYSKLVARLWTQGHGFLLVEQDIQAAPSLLRQIWVCPSLWCAAWAPRYSGAVRDGESKPQHPIRERETALFCHKFATSLLARTQDAMISRCTGLSWRQLDLGILPVLTDAHGGGPHLHGPVRHLHQQHPAWVLAMTEQDWASVGT
jgi:hypothetical protein